MVTSRRALILAGLGACVAWPVAGRAGSALPWRGVILGCQVTASGRHRIAGIDEYGLPRFNLGLESRGHAPVLDETGRYCAVPARRPGKTVAVMDLDAEQVIHSIAARPGHAFCGHALFSGDGRFLYTSENDNDKGRGIIGVYDLDHGAQQVARFVSGGIGPHELAWLPGGETLVVANGGILTHPDTGREKLNLADMSPNLARLDGETGELHSTHSLDPGLHQLGIRHVDVHSDGTVALAMQFEGAEDQHPPLLGIQRGDSAIRLLPAPDEVAAGSRNYAGSVRFDSSGEWLALSCPRGDQVQFYSARSGEYVDRLLLRDACGLAVGLEPGMFVASNGFGEVRLCQITSSGLQSETLALDPAVSWDNHLVVLHPAGRVS